MVTLEEEREWQVDGLSCLARIFLVDLLISAAARTLFLILLLLSLFFFSRAGNQADATLTVRLWHEICVQKDADAATQAALLNPTKGIARCQSSF
jgi:hypothetical protein